MQLFEIEIEDARKRLSESGRSAQDFIFEVEHLPPDPDSPGMFTARYEIDITAVKTGKTLGLIGGIGLAWVDDFVEALAEGHFE